jgi:hypothetical protein
VRATVRTQGFCALQLRLGDAHQAMLVANGTFLYRGGQPLTSAPQPTASGEPRTIELVLIRRGALVEMWVDGTRILTHSALRDEVPVGIGVCQGTATFEDVRIRELPKR